MKLINLIIVLFFSISCSDKSGTNVNTILFTTTAPTKTDHNKLFSYTFNAVSSDLSKIYYEIIGQPTWVSFSPNSKTISGIPGWDFINKTETFTIKAVGGDISELQIIKLKIEVGEIICDIEIGDPLQSRYILPFQKGNKFLCNQSYCPTNPNWGHYNWFALDFEMPIGTPVIAARDGKVLYIEERWTDGNRMSGQANYLYILHDDGTVAEYYHLTKDGVIVKEGDQVQAGQVIALSGDTGPSIGPHLHFVLYRSSWEYSKFQRQWTIPVNFKNSKGKLNEKGGLIYNEYYEAL